MTMRPLLPSIALVGILLTASARADAPATQYSPFDKTDTTIRDPHTRLVWQRYVPAVSSTAPIAAEEANCQKAMTPTYVGRLPTVKELLTLVDEDRHLEVGTSTQASLRAIDRKDRKSVV